MFTNKQTSPSSPKILNDRRLRMYNFLSEHPVGILSTVDPDGNPHGTVVYFTVDKAFIVEFLTKKGTRKYDNLMHNAHTVLTVFEPHTQTTLQLEGVAVEREGRADINRVSRQLFAATERSSIGGLPPIVKLQAGAFTTFRIMPVQARMAIYAKPDTGGYRDLFESVESFELHD